MSSFIRFALFATIVVSLLIFVLVPVAAGALLGSIARDAGLAGDGVKVSVNLLGPGLLSGRAESVNFQGSNVDVPHGVVGHMDLTLGDVSLTDHSFATVSGRLTDVTLNGPGGSVLVQTVDVDGPSNRARANGSVSAAESRKFVKAVAASAGVPVDSVQLKDGSVTLESRGRQTDASLRIVGSALVLDRAGSASTILFVPAPSDDWQLTSVTVSPAGIRLGLNVDAASLARGMGAGGPSPQQGRPLQ